MADKPWEQLQIKAWDFLTKGKRRYITIPVALLVIALPFYKQLYPFYQSMVGFMETTYSYTTMSEDDVFTEHVIKLKSFDDKTPAEEELQRILSEYKAFYKANYDNKHERPIDNSFHVVRSLYNIGEWWLVIYPPNSANSTLSYADSLIENLLISFDIHAPVSMTMIDFYLKKENREVIRYSKEEFERTHGRIKK